MRAIDDPVAFLQSLGAQALAGATMVDTCQRLVYTGRRDADGQEAEPDFVPEVDADDNAVTYPCGFSWGGNGDSDRTSENRENITTETPRFRVPLHAAFTSDDHVRLFSIGGKTLAAPLDFAIAGQPLPGPTVIILETQRVSR